MVSREGIIMSGARLSTFDWPLDHEGSSIMSIIIFGALLKYLMMG